MCKSCGAHDAGRFCPRCGEPAAHDGDLSFRHLTHDFLHEFTHLDGKIWRTLRALALRPGLLTAEYWAGRRGQWIRPLRLYLVISALTLVLSTQTIGPLGYRIWYSQTKDNLTLGTRAPREGALIGEEETHKVAKVYLWVRYLGLFAFAGASLVLYRKKQPYFGAHVIAGMHYYSFAYLLTALMGKMPASIGAPAVVNGAFLYLLLSERRLYGEGWPRTFGKCIFLSFCIFVTEAALIGGSLMAVLRFGHH